MLHVSDSSKSILETFKFSKNTDGAYSNEGRHSNSKEESWGVCYSLLCTLS